jgi:hypothetical protein
MRKLGLIHDLLEIMVFNHDIYQILCSAIAMSLHVLSENRDKYEN